MKVTYLIVDTIDSPAKNSRIFPITGMNGSPGIWKYKDSIGYHSMWQNVHLTSSEKDT